MASRDNRRLTERQVAILALLREGKTRREIAEALGVSEGTVYGHVARAQMKLGAHDREQAVQRAVERGLLPPAADGGRPANGAERAEPRPALRSLRA